MITVIITNRRPRGGGLANPAAAPSDSSEQMYANRSKLCGRANKMSCHCYYYDTVILR